MTAAAAGTGSAKKKWFMRRLMSKQAWSWRFLSSSSAGGGGGGRIFRWKRLNIKLSFFDDILFRFISVFEAIFLVSTVAFFYCFCGCHF